MKKFLPLFLLIFLVACTGSSNGMPRRMPDDFEFYYSRFMKDYDSKTGIYAYTGVSTYEEGNYSTELVLKVEDREKIWNILREIDFLSYPEYYEEPVQIEPSIGHSLIIEYSGLSHKVSVGNVHYNGMTPKRKALYNAIDEIYEILESYPEAQAMDEYIYYLE